MESTAAPRVLTFQPEVEANPASLKVISMNILAQHLIDGELPGYPYTNSKHQDKLSALRVDQLARFLSDHTDFDVLNLQEVGPLDESTIKKALKAINPTKDRFEIVLARNVGGASQLRVCTVFNKTTLTKVSTMDVYCDKYGKLGQFGLVTQFRHNHTQRDFHCVNVHLNAGKNASDDEVRNNQLIVLKSLPLFSAPGAQIVMTGDFNSHIDRLYK